MFLSAYISVHLWLKGCSQFRVLSSQQPPVAAGGDNIADWGWTGGVQPPQGFCAKQTQFWPRQGEGQVVCGKGVIAERTCKEHWKNKAKLGQDRESGGMVRWRGLLCKTKPIAEEVSSVKCQVLSVKQEKPVGGSSDLPTSNFTLQTSGGAPSAQGGGKAAPLPCLGEESPCGRWDYPV